MDSKRIAWIDSLKTIAVFLVILGHNGLRKADDGISMLNMIYAFHMPLFFFISGVLYRKKLPVFMEFRKYFFSLIVPFILYNVLFIGYIAVLNYLKFGFISDEVFFKSLKGIIFATISHPDTAILPCFPTWFFVSLFFVKCLASLFSESLKFKLLAMVIIVCIFVLSMLSDKNLYWHLDSSLYALPFFFGGYLVAKYELADKISNGTMLMVAIHPLLLTVIYLGIKKFLPHWLPYNIFLSLTIAVIVFIILIPPIKYCERHAGVLLGKLR